METKPSIFFDQRHHLVHGINRSWKMVKHAETDNSSKKATATDMADLIKNSYSSLPLDLESISLPDKTLTILVYHFNQSDIGEVPVLASSDKLIVAQHFRKTYPLEQLIR